MFDLIKDNKGFLSLMDTLLSILMLFIILISFNLMMDMDIPSLAEENNDFKTSQDIMEIMSSKLDGREYSTLERISYILSKNNNSISSKREVKLILDDFFITYLSDNEMNYHYAFVESNQLDGEVLSSNGDYITADRLIVAIRNYGNYSYKLYFF